MNSAFVGYEELRWLDPVFLRGYHPTLKLSGIPTFTFIIISRWAFELIRKCSSRLYFLRQLKRSGVAPSELVQFYVTCIRPVLEYASPVFHRSLPNYISEDLERIQRRAFRIIHPDLSYSVALETVGLPKLHERREKISIDLFDEIVCNPTHSLHSLLPQRKSCKYALRRKSDFTLPLCKTERLKESFIFRHVYKM